MSSNIKTGVFVDAENIKFNGGYHMRYDVLRRFAARDGSNVLRLNTYLAYDQNRANLDPDYAKKARAYQQMVRDYGWKINVKYVRYYYDEEGNESTKSNADLDLAVDALRQADNLDQVLLVTGDGDFLSLVQALQDRGCRVELLAFKNVSRELQRQVDAFHSGYLMPDLLPFAHEPENQWGKLHHKVRGTCTKWFPDKGYGFMRFITRLDPNLWITDPRDPDSPHEGVFVHMNDLVEGTNVELMTNREAIFEFFVEESEQKEGGLIASDVRPVFIPGRD